MKFLQIPIDYSSLNLQATIRFAVSLYRDATCHISANKFQVEYYFCEQT
jgi:hypothetical protein